jgi:putative hemolysin
MMNQFVADHDEAPFIMEHTTAYKALERFKKTGIHYAFVADEYGIFKES